MNENERSNIRKDFIFKSIFADISNKSILIDLLKAILKINIIDVEIYKDVSLEKRVELEKLRNTGY